MSQVWVLSGCLFVLIKTNICIFFYSLETLLDSNEKCETNFQKPLFIFDFWHKSTESWNKPRCPHSAYSPLPGGGANEDRFHEEEESSSSPSSSSLLSSSSRCSWKSTVWWTFCCYRLIGQRHLQGHSLEAPMMFNRQMSLWMGDVCFKCVCSVWLC